MRIAAAISLLTGLAVGCDAPPKPADFVARSIQPLPEAFRSRNVLGDASGLLRYTLEEQVGKVLYRGPQDSAFIMTGRVLLPVGYSPSVQLIDQDEGKVYDGLIDRQAATDAAYLAVATKLSGTALATLTIKDRAYSRIPNAQVPWTLLAAEAAHARPDPAARVYWVQGVLLSSVDYRVATEYSASGGGKLTEAFAANGRLYDKSESATYDHHVSVELIDLDYVRENERPLIDAVRQRDSSALSTAVDRARMRLPSGLRVELRGRIAPSNQ